MTTTEAPYVFGHDKPITARELIDLLKTMPPDAILKQYDYAEDFDINQDTYVRHLTSVNEEGFVKFGYTQLDYCLDDGYGDDYFDDAEDTDADA